jgi:EAL and modified HD-GYP domain-containing signal transduction protein
MTSVLKAVPPTADPSRPRDFFLARQPILNRDQGLVAYELLFRRAEHGPAGVTDDRSATASVINRLVELGTRNVIGDALAFVNADARTLHDDFIELLPARQVVLEILETVRPTPELLQRVAMLARAGYTFALDDVVDDNAELQPLLALAAIVKIDITGLAPQHLAALARKFQSQGKKLLAEKVETRAEYDACMALGFDYFQGYYFAKPAILSGKTLTPSQATILQLLAMIVAEADNADIERELKQDASLGLSLMRLLGAPGVGGCRRIDSLSQALMVLGQRQLQRWLQILLYAEGGKSNRGPSPLLVLATMRGKLMELTVQKLKPGNRGMADVAFTVGMMSLMDTLFGLPMEQILGQIAVAEEVGAALRSRDGWYGDMLQMTEYMEKLEESCPLLLGMLDKLDLSTEELGQLQLGACEWSTAIADSMRAAA